MLSSLFLVIAALTVCLHAVLLIFVVVDVTQVAMYNGANREVAILCNHQRTVSSAQKEGLTKQKDRLAMLMTQKHVRSNSGGENSVLGTQGERLPIV